MRLELKESEIELQVCHYLHYEKVFFTKIISTGYFESRTKRFRKQANPWCLPGMSDLLLVIGGKAYFWELKTSKGKQSENQREFERRAVLEGQANYSVIRSLEEAKKELETIKTTGTPHRTA